MCQRIELPVLGIPIYGYGFMILIGFVVASYLAQREARRRGLPGDRILDFAVFLVLVGVVGSRAYFVMKNLDDFRERPWHEVFAIWRGGLVFHGGVIAALPVGWWYLRRHKLPVLSVLDTCAPFVPVGMATGRVGCWLNGCCWGSRCSGDLPWILTRFPAESVVHGNQKTEGFVDEFERTLAVQPVQLYDSLHSILLFGLLWWFLRRESPRGATTFLFIGLYGVGRFFLEILRGDQPLSVTGLTMAQNLSILMALGGWAGVAWAMGRDSRNLRSGASLGGCPPLPRGGRP